VLYAGAVRAAFWPWQWDQSGVNHGAPAFSPMS